MIRKQSRRKFTFFGSSYRIMVLFCICLATSPVVAADELLSDSLDRHQATMDSIRTFHCRVSVTHSPAPSWGNESAEYWRNGNDFRCRSQAGRIVTDCLFRNGVTKQYTIDPMQPGAKETDGRITDKDMAYSCDPWNYGQLSFYGQDRFRVGLKELLAAEGTKSSSRHVEKDGRKLVRIKVSHSRADMEIWLDPSVNYLARHVKTTSPFGEGTATVESFQELAPGLFFPTKVLCEVVSGKDNHKSVWTADFSNVAINGPLATDALAFRFPPNLLVGDSIRHGMFRTNSSGEPVLPAKNSQGQPLTLSEAPQVPSALKDSSGDVFTEATQEEPQSRLRWILPVAALFFAIAAVLWAVRFLRLRRVNSNLANR